MQAKSRAELIVLESLLSLLAKKGIITWEEAADAIKDASAAQRSVEALRDADEFEEIGRPLVRHGSKP